jgi:hypothetical protein
MFYWNKWLKKVPRKILYLILRGNRFVYNKNLGTYV